MSAARIEHQILNEIAGRSWQFFNCKESATTSITTSPVPLKAPLNQKRGVGIIAHPQLLAGLRRGNCLNEQSIAVQDVIRREGCVFDDYDQVSVIGADLAVASGIADPVITRR